MGRARLHGSRFTIRAGNLSWTYYPTSTLPAPYDIVWCRFPFLPDLNPGVYARPGLVRNVALVPDGGADVEVVYGTTKLKLHERPEDFFVTNAALMAACGLDRATRFDLDTLVWLPWAEEWFEPPTFGSSPIIGHLTDHAVKMLQITVSYRQRRAEAKRIEPQLDLSNDGDA